METPIKMDDLGGKPTIFGNTHLIFKSLKKLDSFSGWFLPVSKGTNRVR